MTILSSEQVDKAEDFIFRNGRLLERQLFERLLRSPPMPNESTLHC